MDRECNKCVHHTSGMCSSWNCKMQTVDDVKREAVKEYVEAVEEQLKQQILQYERRAEEHKDYADYHARYWAKKCSYEHALEIVRTGGKGA